MSARREGSRGENSRIYLGSIESSVRLELDLFGSIHARAYRI